MCEHEQSLSAVIGNVRDGSKGVLTRDARYCSQIPRKWMHFGCRVDFSTSACFPMRARDFAACVRDVYAARSGRSNGLIEQQTGVAMSAQKITDEQWTEARKRYETEPGLGLGKIAQVLDCSKSLVARKAREGKWQKDIGVPHQVHPTGKAKDSIFTENARGRDVQAVHVYPGEASTQTARVVADVFVPPTAERGVESTPLPTYADDPTIPEGLDAEEREAFVKAAILARQQAINARHLHETKAVRSLVYAAIKKVDKDGGAAAALAALRIVQALRHMQDSELETELERVRLALGEFHGKPKGPTPCRITVVLEKKGVREVVEVADAQEGMRLGNGMETEIIDVE
jgi:hypothetical protein